MDTFFILSWGITRFFFINFNFEMNLLLEMTDCFIKYYLKLCTNSEKKKTCLYHFQKKIAKFLNMSFVVLKNNL